MRKKYLEIGKIVSTHGIKGEVRIQPWCDNGEFVKNFKQLYLDKNGEKPMNVTACRPHGNIVIVKFDQIEDVQQAMAYMNKILYISTSDIELEDGQYFVQELIGCKVYDVDEESKYYGEIVDVTETGANDVWHIKNEEGKVYLIPNIPPVVIDVDVDEEKVLIRPLRGIFDED